jgi:predicted DNA-binding transcriptional regulator AlpA
MSRPSPQTTRPLLSVDEVVILLGSSRSSIYRSIGRGDLPLPVFKINGRLRIARAAVECLLEGEPPLVCEDGSCNGGEVGEGSAPSLGSVVDELSVRRHGASRPPFGRLGCVSAQPRSLPAWSTARRSSSGTPSVS